MGANMIYTTSPNTGIPVMKPATDTAYWERLGPTALSTLSTMLSMPPDSYMNIPSMTPRPVTMPMEPRVEPKLLVTQAVTSAMEEKFSGAPPPI